MVAAVCLGTACNKGSSASKEDLALVPKEADMIFNINLSRMRTTAMWKKITDIAFSQASVKKDSDDIAANCIDFTSTAEGPDSIFAAFPSTNGANNDGEIIVHLKTAVDDAKIAKCFNFIATKNGEQLNTTDYNGKKIYGSSHTATGDKGGFVALDNKTIAFGTGAWIRRTIDLAANKDQNSASTNAPLVALVKTAKTSSAIWGAGVVPQSLRDSLKNDPRTAMMGSLKSVVGDIDFATGLDADFNMDVGAEADAVSINTQVTSQVAELKKSPQALMLGIAAWLDAVKTEAKGPVFHVNVKLAQPQVDEMIARVQGLVRSLSGGGMGGMGMGGPGMGGPGMGAPPAGMGMAPPSGMAPPAGMGMGAPSGMGTPGAPPTLGTPGLKQPPAPPPAMPAPPTAPAH